MSREPLWDSVVAARRALAEDLATLIPQQWQQPSLCQGWTVEHVVAHLTAAASLNQWQWLRSMIGAGFRPAVHNQRRIEEHLGSTPEQTLEQFRSIIDSTTAPSAHTAAYLGEVLVHAEDIRHPLALNATPDIAALTEVATFFAARNFTVNSRTHARGLRLQAEDGPFTAGEGPLVTGPTLSLLMSLAGRRAHLDLLDGPGVATLRDRLR